MEMGLAGGYLAIFGGLVLAGAVLLPLLYWIARRSVRRWGWRRTWYGFLWIARALAIAAGVWLLWMLTWDASAKHYPPPYVITGTALISVSSLWSIVAYLRRPSRIRRQE